MKTSKSNWKNDLLSMERQARIKDTIAFNLGKQSRKIKITKLISKQKLQTQKNIISKRVIKIMLTVREWFANAKLQEQQRQKALDIKVVEPVIFNTKSLITKILDLYIDSNNPQHITSIISKLEASGYIFKSFYHKYNTVRNTIRSNYFLFARAGKGLYKLRQGLTNEKFVIIGSARAPKQKTNNIPTIKDVAVSVVIKYSDKNGIYPGRVCFILNHMGFKCAYSTVYRAMQSDAFIRNGFLYKIK